MAAALRGELPYQPTDESKETHLIRDMATIFIERLPEATVEDIAREIADEQEEEFQRGHSPFMPGQCHMCRRKF